MLVERGTYFLIEHKVLTGKKIKNNLLKQNKSAFSVNPFHCQGNTLSCLFVQKGNVKRKNSNEITCIKGGLYKNGS